AATRGEVGDSLWGCTGRNHCSPSSGVVGVEVGAKIRADQRSRITIGGHGYDSDISSPPKTRTCLGRESQLRICERRVASMTSKTHAFEGETRCMAPSK